MTKRLVVIDGKSVFYRGYYAMPGLSTKDGTPTGGVFGFASLALEIIRKLNPDYVTVAWDKKGTSIRRRLELMPTYKAGRKKAPDDFFAQIPMLEELLEAFNWPLLECDDYEADDIMGTLAKMAEKEGIETCLITSDLDMLQLVNPLTHVYAMKKGLANIEQFSPEYFEEKYSIRVDQFVDLKSLKGDSSDNIPGVPGVGEKTAITLLQEYDTLDNIYEHLDDIKPTVSKKLVAGRDSAYLSKKVAEIWCDAPVELDLEEMDVHKLDLSAVAAILKRLEFHSLVKRLPEHMQEQQDGGLFVENKIDSLRVIEWTNDLQVNEQVAMHLYDEKIYLSTDKGTVMTTEIVNVDARVWSMLSMCTVVGYDVKAMMHTLERQAITTDIDEVHDIRQAAFLIDPLQRDRSLASLFGVEVAEDNPGDVMAALWSVYGAQVEAFTHLPKVATIAKDYDFPLVRVLFDIESRGVKIDVNLLKTMSDQLATHYEKLQQEMYKLVGYEFNIGSPAQLSEVLFTKLQLPTTGIKKGKTGYSTGQKELDKLRGQHPLIELIEQTREIAKMKNTYVDSLPLLVDDSNRLHTTFNQDVAATGRLSSTNPNLQNIPIRSELGKTIRQAFIAEEGNVLVSADYSQFELRLAAILANDTQLIDDFNSDIDVHTKTASDVYHIPLADITKDQRRAAKVINFGVLYGMSPHGLSAATGMSFMDAKSFIDNYFELRKPIREFIDATLDKAKNEGYVETYYGRRRPTPDVNSSNFMVREGAKRAAANMPIQGTEADLMKKAMIEIERKIGNKGKQILQIHDSILIECPEANADEIGTMLKSTMESIAPELGIKLKVDVSTGTTWGSL